MARRRRNPPPTDELGATPSRRQTIDGGLFRTTRGIVLAKAVSGAGSAGVVVVTARQLAPEGRGVFVLLFTLTTFALFACGLGVNISGRLELVAADDPVRSGDYLGLTCALTLLQALVCALLAVTLLPLLDVRLSASTVVAFTLLGGSVIAGYLIIDALNAYGHTVPAAVVDAVAGLLQLAFVLIVAALGATTVEPFLAALFGAYALEIVLGLYVLRRIGVPIRPHYHWPHWLRLLRRGPSAMAIQLGQLSIFKIDRYLVALFLSPAAVGVYSVAAAFPELLRIAPNAMAQPVFYRLASRSASVRDFARARRLCLALMVVVGAVIALAAPSIVSIAFGPEYSGAVTPLRLLLVAELGLAVFYIDGASLSGQDRVRETAAAVVAGVVVAVASYLVLIPAFGINGAAIGSIAAYFTMGLVARIYLSRSERA
jgi:O-antigen/teichoic acid export membrane protein